MKFSINTVIEIEAANVRDAINNVKAASLDVQRYYKVMPIEEKDVEELEEV